MTVPSAAQRVAAQAAIEKALPFGAFDTEREPWRRFANNLVQALALRSGLDLSDGTIETYFCLVDRPYRYGEFEGAAACGDFDCNLTCAIEGRLILVSEAGNGGISFQAGGWDLAVAKLKSLGLAATPSATYYPHLGLVRFYPEGFEHPETQTTVNIVAPRTHVTAADIKAVIDDFHDSCLCTPQHVNGSLWEEAVEWIPNSNAEKQIQWPLKAALVLGFREIAIVRAEEINAVGDTDFTIYSKSGPRDAPPHAIVEVKVQKSHREGAEVQPAETRREYIRGLIQTAAYRNIMTAPYAMLACFDLRKPGAGSVQAWNSAKARTEKVVNALSRSGRGGPPEVVSWLLFADTQSAQAAATQTKFRVEEVYYPVQVRPNYKTLMEA